MRADRLHRLEAVATRLAALAHARQGASSTAGDRLRRARLDEDELFALVEARDVIQAAKREGRELTHEMLGNPTFWRALGKVRADDPHAC